MKVTSFFTLFLCVTVVFSVCDAETKTVEKSSWELVWQDEFDGPQIDNSKWDMEVNARGGGNNELQFYTDLAKNARIEDGVLVIEARKEKYSSVDPSDKRQKTRSYTSARLRTKNKGDWTYGRFEFRAKMPLGQGLWPAIWMMPTDSVYGGWAASGEIDIMEYLGHEPEKVYGTLHYGGRWPKNKSSERTFAPFRGGKNYAEAFHTFVLEWEAKEFRWYIDGKHYMTQTKWHTEGAKYPAPFDERFHMILNLAVGGNWPGNPDDTTVFPQRFSIDYVRVYQLKDSTRKSKTYRNPIIDAIGPADPTVIRYEGKYYMYPTWDGKGYDVFVSDDLVKWKREPMCYVDSRGGAWAPDVFHNVNGDGKFYLYYTVNKPGGGKLVGVAVADDPLGPFVDKGNLFENNVIDAHMFEDEDGKLYLYYVRIGNPFVIFVQRMSDPLTKRGRVKEVIRPTVAWEQRRGKVTEGPWMLKHNGLYYLMYSGSGANGPEYSIGYATSKSPMGPFLKYSGNPIATAGNGVYGPGHHCVVEGDEGRLWMVYHQQNSTKVSWERFLAIDPLWFDEDGVIHVKTTRGTDEPLNFEQ